MPHKYNSSLLALALLLLLAPLQPLSAAAVDIADLDHQLLRAPAGFLQTDAQLTLDDARERRFAPLTASDVNRGISGETYWIRVRLDNVRSDRPRHWLIHHETSYLDDFVVHYADAGGIFRTRALSDRLPFHSRAEDYRKLAFRHSTPAGSYTDLYLELRNQKPDSVSLNVHLWDLERFHSSVQRQNLGHGAYFGILLTLLAVTLLCAALLRDKVYVHYGVFLLLTGVLWALMNGYAYQYLWPASVFWHNEGFHIVFLLFAISALQFSRGFLKTRQRLPSVDRVILVLQLVMATGILIRFMGVYEPVLYLAYGALSVLLLLPLLGVQAYRDGLRYARWYVAAWLAYAGGLVVAVLSASTSLLPWGMQPLVYAQVGSLVEAFLLVVALGERLVGWERDRRSALRMANQDPLTGLGNRRQLSEAFNALSDTGTRSEMPAFMLMIDLDHFKEINDTYGHEAGDAVLLNVAALLVRQCRANDTCVRYGGEEFAMLFQAPSVSDAQEVAERIRREFSRIPTSTGGRRIRHTLSAGLVQVLPLTSGHDGSLQSLIAMADGALYMAKRAGRNRVMVREQAAVA
ncbi:MAG: sensor domain-containing diguanylate cyclase [Ectothiorhodospiraceae bacterium]|nr:sensor domain-containing diguanylate cyclase [Ectothiorhodospiraceae bacterium]